VKNWPWADEFYKPGTDPVRTLVKAGGLIAAAIDALLEERNRATVQQIGDHDADS
jgi:hypothetical protein